MSKFGEIILSDIPVLLTFNSSEDVLEDEVVREFLKEIATRLQSKVRILQLDNIKNKTLVDALKINHFPAFLLYHKGQLKWRESGEVNQEEIIEIISRY